MSVVENMVRENLWSPNCIQLDRLMKGHLQDSDEWHELRRKTIGSSEAAAVFPGRISSTVTPLDLFRKLKGEPRTPVSPFLQSLFDRGNYWEPRLRRELEKLLNCYIVESGVFVHYRAGDTDISASLDGIAVKFRDDGNTNICLAEFKYRCNDKDAGWGPQKDKLGLTVWCQVQHQMRVTGVPTAVVYSGCDSGARRLWVVQQAPPDYRVLWEKYASRLESAVRSGAESPDRASAGESAHIEQKLRRWMRSTVLAFRPKKI